MAKEIKYMQIIKNSFTDFNIYNNTIKDWHLEYNILSSNDFFADLNLFQDQQFGLTRLKLKGKLVHTGLSPNGYRTFIIPVNYNNKFIYFDRGTSGNELIIFPKNNKINAVTFNNFEAFIISIENSFLKEKLEQIEFYKCEEIFGESELELFLSKEFSAEFYKLANYFLTKHINSVNFAENKTNKHKELVNIIIDKLLKYIEITRLIKKKQHKNKKNFALKEALDIIHSNNSVYSIKELSALTNVSERTLLYAFKEKFNVSPSEYIKAYRLNKVKVEIFEHKGKNISISTIAGKYHFWHMGQFAKDFKKQFGILPSKVFKN